MQCIGWKSSSKYAVTAVERDLCEEVRLLLEDLLLESDFRPDQALEDLIEEIFKRYHTATYLRELHPSILALFNSA